MDLTSDSESESAEHEGSAEPITGTESQAVDIDSQPEFDVDEMPG